MDGLKGKHEILFSFITPDSLVILPAPTSVTVYIRKIDTRNSLHQIPYATLRNQLPVSPHPLF